MKPFNLKEYLANPSRKVVTRDGRDVRIHCTNYGGLQPIIAEIEGSGFSESFTKYGGYYNPREPRNDLFFATEKPKVEKFDLKTLRPFDKALVRVDKNDCWMAAHFSHVDDYLHKAVCDTFYYTQCIPYNEETKHLVGTKEDCPEYYKWWEE